MRNITIHKLKKIQKGILPILFLLFLWTCSAGEGNIVPAEVGELENLKRIPTDIQPTCDIAIQKDEVFGDFKIKAGSIGSIADVAVDDSGRVFISDTRQKTIHVFGPDGQFLQNLGRDGMGPGEFSHIYDMKIQDNRLFAFDPDLFQINFYSLESLTFDHVEGLYPQDWADNQNIRDAILAKFYDWDDNNMLIGFKQVMGPNIYYYIIKNSNHRTKIISDPILVQKNEEYMTVDVELPNGMVGLMNVPFGRKSLFVVTEDRHIFSAWTDQFFIKEYDPKGTYLRAWYYPYPNPSLTQTEIDSIANPDDIAYVERAINEYEAPATWPALNDMRIDDQNRFWISTVVEDPSVTEWWILEMDGTLLGRFTWAKQKQIEAIKNSYLYTKETDRETGIQEVVRYQVEMKKQ